MEIKDYTSHAILHLLLAQPYSIYSLCSSVIQYILFDLNKQQNLEKLHISFPPHTQ